MEAFLCWIPTHYLADTKRFTFNEPFHLEFSALLLRKLGNDGLKSAILTGFEPLTVFSIGIDDTRVEIRFASHNNSELTP
jgi:hypothetical protein